MNLTLLLPFRTGRSLVEQREDYCFRYYEPRPRDMVMVSHMERSGLRQPAEANEKRQFDRANAAQKRIKELEALVGHWSAAADMYVAQRIRADKRVAALEALCRDVVAETEVFEKLHWLTQDELKAAGRGEEIK